jgi:hypothetical protein
MPVPTPEFMRSPAFRAMLNSSEIAGRDFLPIFAPLRKRPKFRKMREVHAQRARKLRKRGEYVHFLRWEHGHCIYGWSGEPPKTIHLHRMPRAKSEPVYTQINYITNFTFGS